MRAQILSVLVSENALIQVIEKLGDSEQDSLKSRSQVEGWDQDSNSGSGFTGQ
jgi:hypothetical protein